MVVAKLKVVTRLSTKPARPGLTSELVCLPSFLAKILSQTPPSPPSDFLLSCLPFTLASRVTANTAFLVIIYTRFKKQAKRRKVSFAHTGYKHRLMKYRLTARKVKLKKGKQQRFLSWLRVQSGGRDGTMRPVTCFND